MTDFDLLTKAAQTFNLDKIKESELLIYPLSNQNFVVTFYSGEQYIFRILKGQTLGGLQEEFLVRDTVDNQGLPTSSFLLNKEAKRFSIVDEVVVTVSPLIAGTHPTTVTLAMCHEMGRRLGQFHTATQSLTLKNKGWMSFEVAKKSLEHLKTHFADTTSISTIEQVLGQSPKLFELPLPRGVIHGDYQYQNLLFQGEKIVAVLDFEESENNLLIIDIARSVANLRNWTDFSFESLQESFFAGYESYRVITAAERQAYEMAHNYACAACAIWMFNRDYLNTGYNYLRQILSQ